VVDLYFYGTIAVEM